MASAILSAKDIHNHLVPLALSRGTRVVVTRVVPSSISFYEGMLVASFPIRRKRGTVQKKDLSMSSLLPSFLPSSCLVSNSLDFLLLPSVPFDARVELPEFRASIQSEHTGEETKFRLYFAVGTRARNKGRRLGFLPRFTSLQPGAFCRSALLY